MCVLSVSGDRRALMEAFPVAAGNCGGGGQKDVSAEQLSAMLMTQTDEGKADDGIGEIDASDGDEDEEARILYELKRIELEKKLEDIRRRRERRSRSIGSRSASPRKSPSKSTAQRATPTRRMVCLA